MLLCHICKITNRERETNHVVMLLAIPLWGEKQSFHPDLPRQMTLPTCPRITLLQSITPLSKDKDRLRICIDKPVSMSSKEPVTEARSPTFCTPKIISVHIPRGKNVHQMAKKLSSIGTHNFVTRSLCYCPTTEKQENLENT